MGPNQARTLGVLVGRVTRQAIDASRMDRSRPRQTAGLDSSEGRLISFAPQPRSVAISARARATLPWLLRSPTITASRLRSSGVILIFIPALKPRA